ncbi:MAG TPA: SIMPL domain-containing protein [Methylophilaceae bacterium]|jgi:hypothetical protein
MASQNNRYVTESAILGAFLLAGLLGAATLLANGILDIKQMERTVEVKGLSEREVPADIVIWPISFNMADNDLVNLYQTIERQNAKVVSFLKSRGFGDDEITISTPSVVDKLAREYDSSYASRFRYTANSTITVYSNKVDLARETMNKVVELGREGIAIAGDNYSTQYIYSRLNQIKPEMIEEATRNARQAADKFAKDSDSRLGKIKRASQGTFSIEDRDSSTAHIKKVRVVSTVEYYLSD